MVCLGACFIVVVVLLGRRAMACSLLLHSRLEQPLDVRPSEL